MTADPATAPAGHAALAHLPGRAAAGAYAWGLLAATVAAVVAIDQATKAAIKLTMAVGETVPLVPTLDLHHTTNRGIAFGLFQGLGDVHLPIAFVVVVVLLSVFRSLHGRATWMRLALSLQVGGAIGNIIDRVRTGAVTDFISFHVDAIGFQFAVFNVADSAITVGSLILIATLLLLRDQ